LLPKPQTDYNHQADFSHYHTFSFGKVHTANPLYEQRVRRDVTEELTKDGLQMAPSGGDLVITAIGDTHNKQEYNSFYNGLGGDGFGWGGWGGDWGGGGMGQTTTSVQEVPVGTLMVDLYDNQNKQLVWRGRSSGKISDSGDKNRKNLEKAVDKMFKDFPPKK